MQHLSRYRWFTLILLAIVCQLVSARFVDNTVKQQLTPAYITQLDQIVLAAAPKSPFASVEGKSPEHLKINGGFGKFVTSLTTQHLDASTDASQLILRAELRSAPVERLWLRYRTLLL